MTIAVNTRFLLKGKLEGIGWFTYEVLKRLVKMRPNDQFIFIFDRTYDPDFIFADNITPVVVSPPARHPFLWYLWFEWSIPKILKKHKADIFLSPDGFCSLRAKTPTLMVTHDIAFVHYPEQVPTLVAKYYNYFAPLFFNRAEKIATVSAFTRFDIIQKFGISPEKIAITHNGCRDTFKPLSDIEKENIRTQYSQGQPYFFYAGAFHPRKNIDRLIKAFDIFKAETQSTTKLILGGKFAWQTGSITDALNNSPYKNDIILTGYLSEEELPLLMGAALALTYVSSFEGFGLPILEAMHCDVPVITSNTSSMPEVANNAAFLVSPNDIEDIANGLIQINKYTFLRDGLVEKGKVQREFFNWDNTATQIGRLIDQL